MSIYILAIVMDLVSEKVSPMLNMAVQVIMAEEVRPTSKIRLCLYALEEESSSSLAVVNSLGSIWLPFIDQSS